jgi:hypothetical protein
LDFALEVKRVATVLAYRERPPSVHLSGPESIYVKLRFSGL